MDESGIPHLIKAVTDLTVQIERMSEKQAEMLEDVKKIKEAVYNPDSGLYARIRSLEQWKTSQAKIQWMVSTTVIGLLIATVYKAIFET